MERVGRVSKNAAALIGARLVTYGLTFVLVVLINRKLGPELAGIYNYAFAIYTIFQVIPDFGIGNISVRDISQDNSRMRRYFNNIVSLRFLLSLLAFSLLMLTNFVTLALQGTSPLSMEKFWVVFTLAFCLLIEQPFSNSLAENFIALERLTVIALVYVIMGIMKVGLSVYVIMAGVGSELVFLMGIYMLTYIYSIFHFYIMYRRILKREDYGISGASDKALAEAVAHGPELSAEAGFEALLADFSFASMEEEEGVGGDDLSPGTAHPPAAPPPAGEDSVFRIGGFTLDGGFWRYILASAWPLAVVGAGVTIYAGLDIPLLSWIKGDTEVGFYAAASMFAKSIVFLTLAINMAVLPAVSKVGAAHLRKLGEIWERMMRYAWILVIPLAVIIPVIARPVLILQEHQFINAWHATWLTMAAMNFTFMTAISFPFFIVINKQKTITLVVIIGLVVKVVLDLVTIPLWGYTGAAVTMVVSEFVVFAMLYRTLSRELGHRINLARFAGAPLLCLGSLYATAFLLQVALVRGNDTFMSSLQYAFMTAVILTILYLALALGTRMLSRKGLDKLNDLLTV